MSSLKQLTIEQSGKFKSDSQLHVFSGEYLHQRTVVAKENLKEKILSRFTYPGVMISLLQRQQKFQVNKRISPLV